MMFLSFLIALTAGTSPDKVVISKRKGFNFPIMGIYEKQEREVADRPVYYKKSECDTGPDYALFWSAKKSRWTVGLVPLIPDRDENGDLDLEALGTAAFAEGDLSDPTLSKHWNVYDNGMKPDENLECQSIGEITKNSDAIVVHDWYFDFYGVNGVYHRQESLLADGRPVWMKEPIGDEKNRWVIRHRSDKSAGSWDKKIYQWCIDNVENFELNGLPRENRDCVTFEKAKYYRPDSDPWSGDDFKAVDKPYAAKSYHYPHMTHFEKSAEHTNDMPQPPNTSSNPEAPTPEPATAPVPEVPASSPEPIPAPESTPVYDWKNTLPCGKWKDKGAYNISISDGHLKANLLHTGNMTTYPRTIDVIPGVCYRNEKSYFAVESIFDVPQLPFDVQLPKGSWIQDARSPRIEDGVLHCELGNKIGNTITWLERSIKFTEGTHYTVKKGEFALEEDDSALKTKMLTSNSNGSNLEQSEKEQNRLNEVRDLNSSGSDHTLALSCMSLATSILALIVSIYALFSRKRRDLREPLLQ